jgi:light-regulated signal transduction histidine kinase (bacteriophytochrome)
VRDKISLPSALVLTTGIFISDVLTPIGFAEWLFYFIPLFIAAPVLKPLYMPIFTSVCTILIILGFFISPHGGDITLDIVNRTIGVCALWVILFLIVKGKRAEETIIELNKKLNGYVIQLEDLNKELEAFSYSVSHDLRAPLRHMSDFVKLLRQRLTGHSDEKIDSYAAMIVEASKRMEMLIDDLLSFAQVAHTEMQKRKVSFNALAREVVKEIKDAVTYRNIIWKIDELPDVYGDQSLLKLMLFNLISNAVKFTGTRPQAEIEIGFKENIEEFIFFVKDNGAGFDMKHVDRLFGVFQRLHTQVEFEGTGIGLANVQRIISRHGGRVWAECAVGKGATLYFTLPKTKEA